MKLLDTVNDFYFNMTIDELRHINGSHQGKSISYTSIMYLGLIAYMDHCTVSALAKALDLSKPAVTSKVNELVAQGLVTRTQSERDKRVYYLRPDEAIGRSFDECDRPLLDAAALVEAEFSQEKIESFCEILQVFSKAFRKVNEHHGKPQAI